MASAKAYNERRVRPQYDDPASYGVRESFYGDGKYPPDWNARREAVWERQDYRCGRCGRYKGDVQSEVHHVIFLSQGGSNALENLVGLCSDCHNLMHPELTDMRGTYAQAPLFPDVDADDRVAVIRAPPSDGELATDLQRVERLSQPDHNRYAIGTETLSTSAQIAKRAKSEREAMLLGAGYVPRRSDYHRVRVCPQFDGVLGAITSYTPELEAESDGELEETERSEEDWTIYYTPDATQSTVTLYDGDGSTSEEHLSLPESDHGARLRLETPVTPPPLSLRTAPRYTADAVEYLGWRSLTWGYVPAVLVGWRAPAYVPLDGSVPGVLLLVLLLGLLLRAPWLLRDAANTAERTTIDERDAEDDAGYL